MRNYLFNGLIFALSASCLLGEPSQEPSEANKSNRAKNSFYTVVRGDTIDSVAKKLGVSRDTIIELNPEIDPTKLRLGAKIKTSIALDNFYIVEKGDTIQSIVTKTGVPQTTIEKLNYGINPKALRVGSKIKIK